MPLFLLSYLAGVLTILAPCVLPILPVIIGGSAEKTNRFRPYIIIGSFLVSTLAFTLTLQVFFLYIPRSFLTNFSGSILAIMGLILLFPEIWDWISFKLGFSSKTSQMIQKNQESESFLKPIFLGISLGPIFSSCSPTFSLIIGIMANGENFLAGFSYSLVYLLGLTTVLIPISILGRKIINKLRWAANPEGIFKKLLGGLFIIIGFSIILGIDKQIETALLNSGYYDTFSEFENSLIER